MIAVIFEVWPREGMLTPYLDMAAAMRSEFEGIDGFVSVERFESITTKGKYLSLSFWRDETALAEWRSRHTHRQAQRAGRDSLFADYRLRVASVLRDYGMTDRDEAPDVLRAAHG